MSRSVIYHSSFGSAIKELSYAYSSGTDTSKYRYGFNGEELENNIDGEGMVYDLGARFYDARLGRMFSLDPLEILYPYWSPYSYCGNNPITIVDINGMGKGDGIFSVDDKNGQRGVWGIAQQILGKGASNKDILALTKAIIIANNLKRDAHGNAIISTSFGCREDR